MVHPMLLVEVEVLVVFLRHFLGSGNVLSGGLEVECKKIYITIVFIRGNVLLQAANAIFTHAAEPDH
jgi:hypothetical protein